MMKKTKMDSSIKLVIIIFLFVTSCGSKSETKNKVSEEFNFEQKLEVLISDSLIQSNSDSLIINFSTLTQFDWDSLFIFEPYTSTDLIKEELGFKWKSARKEIQSLGETKTLLVFLKNGEITYTCTYPRNKGDFIKLEKRGPYLIQDGVFTVRKEKYGDEDWLFFYFTPPNPSM